MIAILGARVTGIEMRRGMQTRQQPGERIGLLIEGLSPDAPIVPGIVAVRPKRRAARLVDGRWVL